MATGTKAKLKHTCQYGQPCAACKASGLIPVGSNTQAALRKAMERTRNYRGQEAIESVKLPRFMPGADGYGQNGEPRFKTRQAYKEAGRRAGMVWQ